MAGSSIGELFVKLGFDVDDSKLKSFDESLRSTFNTALGFAGVTAGVAGFFTALNSSADTATKIKNLNTELGIGKQQAAEFAAAFHTFNPLSSFSTGLDVAGNVGKYIQAMKLGQAGNEAGFFGVTGADNTFEKFNDRIRANIGQAIQRWGVDVVSQKLSAIYGTADAINYLTKSTEQLAEAAKKGPFGESEQQNLENYNTSLADLGNSLDQLKAKWLALPAKEIADFLKSPEAQDHPGALVGIAAAAAGVLSLIGARFTAIYGAIGLGSWAIGQDYGNTLHKQGYRWAPGGATGPFGDRPFGFYKEGAGDPENQLESYGWSSAQAAGVLKRLMIESNMNPAAVGDNGQAYGIAQWHPDRQAQFAKWAGKPIQGSTVEEQLAFLNYEMTNGLEQKAGEKLRQSKTQDEAYDNFTKLYERPATMEVTNNFNITGTDPHATAQAAVDIMQHAIDNAHASLVNNGQY